MKQLLNDFPHEEWNDTLPSVEVPPYFKVELFENSTFSGATKKLINKSIVPKLYNVYDFNDITSAYKITDILSFPYKR